jgi:hypothetical protein
LEKGAGILTTAAALFDGIEFTAWYPNRARLGFGR